MIEQKLKDIIQTSIEHCVKKGLFELKEKVDVEISTPKIEAHGDFSTNVALVLASRVGKKPREVAELIVNSIDRKKSGLKDISVAGPGFINFTFEPVFYLENLKEIFDSGEKFGQMKLARGKKLQVEFVSANPTGPLHIGHGRGAVYGDVLANIFKALGYDVTKEYYVNDAGNQIKTLGRSVYLRLKELKGEKIDFPSDCYQGHYILDIAREVEAKEGAKIAKMDEEKATLYLGEYAGSKILEEIKRDLAETGVVHDIYFFEHKLYANSNVEKTIAKLKERGHVFEEGGAIWFRTTAFGDDKDRVLKKSDGSLTYFAADIVYHKNKYERGFARVIDIWGADHGGYVARMKACVAALGYDPNSFDAVLIQLVNLMRGGELVSMSTRSAMYETLEDVRKEVGRDVCRYFFLMRSHNAQLDFDLELAKSQTSDNPVFYIQYANARISSIFKKAAEKGLKVPKSSKVDLKLLDLPEEPKLARMAGEFPQVLLGAAEDLEPHKLAFYLLELARMFQSYYSQGRRDGRYMVIGENDKKAAAKLYLLKNIQIVLQNGLKVLGISAPDVMERNECIVQ